MSQSIRTHFSDDQLKELINFALHYFADLDIPVKRGTFVEFRSGMLNMSPIGRNCSQEERDAFEEYDKEAKVRETMVGIMREKFAHMDLTCAPTCSCLPAAGLCLLLGALAALLRFCASCRREWAGALASGAGSPLHDRSRRTSPRAASPSPPSWASAGGLVAAEHKARATRER